MSVEINGALRFNGRSSYVDIPWSETFSLGNALTVMAWVRKRGNANNISLPAQPRLCHILFQIAGVNNIAYEGAPMWSAAGGRYSYNFCHYGGAGPDTWVYYYGGTNKLRLGYWDHMCFTLSSNGYGKWITNGYVTTQLQCTSGYANIWYSDTYKVLIGNSLISSGGGPIVTAGVLPTGEEYGFNGDIDELRVYNTCMTNSQVWDCYDQYGFGGDYLDLVLPGNCVAAYHMDECEGEWIYDASGNGNHGKIICCEWICGSLTDNRLRADFVDSDPGGIWYMTPYITTSAFKKLSGVESLFHPAIITPPEEATLYWSASKSEYVSIDTPAGVAGVSGIIGGSTVFAIIEGELDVGPGVTTNYYFSAHNDIGFPVREAHDIETVFVFGSYSGYIPDWPPGGPPSSPPSGTIPPWWPPSGPWPVNSPTFPPWWPGSKEWGNPIPWSEEGLLLISDMENHRFAAYHPDSLTYLGAMGRHFPWTDPWYYAGYIDDTMGAQYYGNVIATDPTATPFDDGEFSRVYFGDGFGLTMHDTLWLQYGDYYGTSDYYYSKEEVSLGGEALKFCIGKGESSGYIFTVGNKFWPSYPLNYISKIDVNSFTLVSCRLLAAGVYFSNGIFYDMAVSPKGDVLFGYYWGSGSTGIVAYDTSNLNSLYIVKSGHYSTGMGCDSKHLWFNNNQTRCIVGYDINTPHTLVHCKYLGRNVNWPDSLRGLAVDANSGYLYIQITRGGGEVLEKYTADSLTLVHEASIDSKGYNYSLALSPNGLILFGKEQFGPDAMVWRTDSLTQIFGWNLMIAYDANDYIGNPTDLNEIYKWHPNRTVGPCQFDYKDGHLYYPSVGSRYFLDRVLTLFDYPWGGWNNVYYTTTPTPYMPVAITAIGSMTFGAMESPYYSDYPRNMWYAASFTLVASVPHSELDHDLKSALIRDEFSSLTTPVTERVYGAVWNDDAVEAFATNSVTNVWSFQSQSMFWNSTRQSGLQSAFPLSDNSVIVVADNRIYRINYDTKSVIASLVVSPTGDMLTSPDYGGVTWSPVNSYFYVIDRMNAKLEKRSIEDLSLVGSVGHWGKGPYEFKMPRGIVFARYVPTTPWDYKCFEEYPVWFPSPNIRVSPVFGDIPFRLYDIKSDPPVYLTDSDKPVFYESNSYLPLPISMGTVKKQSSTPVENVGVGLSNVNREVTRNIRAAATLGKEVVIRKSYWTGTNSYTPPYVLYRGQIDSLSIEERGETSEISVDIRADLAAWQFILPKNQFNTQCQWIFKSTTPGCQYVGPGLKCDRSYNECVHYQNTLRFRGFQNIEPLEREIWWGKPRASGDAGGGSEPDSER